MSRFLRRSLLCGAALLSFAIGDDHMKRREDWAKAMRERCRQKQSSASGIKSPRIALDCGTSFAAGGDSEAALAFYELGLSITDPLLHADLLPQFGYRTALAERAAGRVEAAARRFKGLLDEAAEPERSNVDWWHEGLTALRDAGWHQDAERLFVAAQAAIPQAKWRHSWQLPRDIDERALEGAKPFHDTADFAIPELLQTNSADLLAEFASLRSSARWEELFETNVHEAGGNVAAGSWRHLYLKRLNGTWDEAKCRLMPRACGLLRGRPEIDGHIFRADASGVARAHPAATPLASSQGFAVLELAPQSHLRLHTGRNNYRLLAHLGLQVPAGVCGLRVGGEERLWQEGRVVVLDDSFLHEAWNNSTETSRYVLYVSFFPPSLQPELPRTDPRGDEL